MIFLKRIAKCKNCGKLMNIHGKGFCSLCYSKILRGKRKVKCNFCKQEVLYSALALKFSVNICQNCIDQFYNLIKTKYNLGMSPRQIANLFKRDCDIIISFTTIQKYLKHIGINAATKSQRMVQRWQNQQFRSNTSVIIAQKAKIRMNNPEFMKTFSNPVIELHRQKITELETQYNSKISDLLTNWYNKEELSFGDIGKKININKATVRLWHKKYCIISPRTSNEAMRTFNARQKTLQLKIEHFAKIKLEDILRNANDITNEKLLRLIDEARISRLNPLIVDMLVSRNIHLIKKIAYKWAYGCKFLSYEDLVQEGVIGLINAIKLYDCEMSCQFSTYAYPAIEQKIIRAIQNTEQHVRLSVHAHRLMQKIKTLSQKHNISFYEASKLINMSNDMRDSINFWYHRPPISIDQKISESENSSLIDFIINQPGNHTDIDEKILEGEKNINLDELLKSAGLSEREQLIIELRHGIGNNEVMTLEGIGQNLGICRERVRQIERDAILKIKKISTKIKKQLE